MPHPKTLTDHAAVAPHRQAILATRQTVRGIEDYMRQLQRDREEVDPDGLDPVYEPIRQRERAGHDELLKLRASCDRMLLIFRNIEDDLRKLATPPAP